MLYLAAGAVDSPGIGRKPSFHGVGSCRVNSGIPVGGGATFCFGSRVLGRFWILIFEASYIPSARIGAAPPLGATAYLMGGRQGGSGPGAAANTGSRFFGTTPVLLHAAGAEGRR